MKIYNDFSNMVFDDDDPRCRVYVSRGQNGTYGFVQCLDIGNKGLRLSTPGIKRYWGDWNVDNPERSIKSIMRTGGKWPELPSREAFSEHENLEYITE